MGSECIGVGRVIAPTYIKYRYKNKAYPYMYTTSHYLRAKTA